MVKTQEGDVYEFEPTNLIELADGAWCLLLPEGLWMMGMPAA